MSRIRGRGNKETELTLAALFRREGIVGWRRHVLLRIRDSQGHEAQTANRKSKIKNQKSLRASSRRLLRVRPDFVLPKLKVAVFVDGCFWHGCPKHCNQPANHRAFWRRKLEGNKARDRKVNRALRTAGWRVVRIWEHDLAKRPEACLRRIQAALEAVASV